ncbi:Undecaprenyl-phosphate galactosephosphotransferase [Moritella sp. PE36]|uniref:sugar transferase n=1 Tax=Moritella sp. PE36 TaxID=58051 RepID=UPI00015681BC|nr:sugar transferase [Moritella sp. PE36]EDM69042.1 Undecaprenyl-phosphate galactosephosphotransferase [Moritella sp. PE36]
MKRLFDILSSLVVLLCVLPLFLIVAIIIAFDNFGPVFYTQKRIGLNGKEFAMYKFRSMRVDADKIGPYFTSTNDPRITRAGRWLRRTSIDELPQLLNVLLGSMSVVGPRPNVAQQQELYTPEMWYKRNTVKPGITGLAQATKRSAATVEERDSLDLEYVDKHNVMFDLKIIFMTIKQVVVKGGN